MGVFVSGVSFFCANLSGSTRRRRKTPEKGLVPGVPRARTSRFVLLEGLSSQSGSRRGMRHPIHSHTPDGEEAAGMLEPLLTLRLLAVETQPLPMNSGCFPSVLPLVIAHSIAQHDARVDVVSTEAA